MPTTSPLNTHRRTLTQGLLLAAMGVPAWLALGGCSTRDPAPSSKFVLLDGSSLESQQLLGKVTLVNFWATTCTTCVQEMPALVQTHQKYQAQGFETIAVAMNYDPVAWVVNFAKTRQLPFKVAIDGTGSLARQWGDVQLTPTTFVVDKKGHIVKRYVGAPDFAALHQLLEQLLQET